MHGPRGKSAEAIDNALLFLPRLLMAALTLICIILLLVVEIPFGIVKAVVMWRGKNERKNATKPSSDISSMNIGE